MSRTSSVEHRLARLLDSPLLARVVPHLPPETLHQLIRDRGIEACGELVASATPAQLTVLIDLDLCRHARPGRDHRFDVDRFGEWLEVLVDTAPSAAARIVVTLDKDLVVAGLSRYVRVFDPGIFEPTAQTDDEPPDRHEAMREGGGDWVECDVGGYLVRARRTDAWDAITTLLVTLETEHNDDFHALMQGCRGMSNSTPEVDGLDDLVPAPEQQLYDVAIERDRRRSRLGYATPADARAFLAMARQPKHPRSGARFTPTTPSIEANPIATAYFRAVDDASESSNETARSPKRELESRSPTGAAHSLDADVASTASLRSALELLAEAGLMPQRPCALLEPADKRLRHLRRLMACVRDEDETAYFTRSRELAFLANTLLAGCSVQSRPFTPQEASDAAAGICNLGLEYWPDLPTIASAEVGPFPRDSLLIDHDLVTAFEVGWSVLHQDVSLFAADQLISTLSNLSNVARVDRDVRLGLAMLRHTLAKQRDAGTPWLAREAAEILAMLDMTVWISVLGLLDECPVLPAALTAVLEGRITTVSATAFDFISTAAQIDRVRLFMRKLPDVLSR